MKYKIAAIAVIALLTLSVIAVGFSAVGEAQDATASSIASAEQERSGEDNAAVSAFKFVCPFH